MSDFKAQPASMLRIDTSRTSQYLYADAPKLNFGQKLARGFGKAFSFLGPIGAAVTAVALPGIGIPIGLGIYGASRVAGDATRTALGKDAASLQAYNQQVANTPVSLPGLFEQQTPSEIQTDFIAPSQFQPQINQTLEDRQVMQGVGLKNF